MENPLVSVIIPTYNRPDYLKLTIESVLNQTYSNIEIIVVDDGSPTNASALLCESYATIIYIRIPNSGGPATPRNIGMKKAEGEFIALVDDDDIWLPQKIEKQLSVLKNEPTFGLVHGPCQLIDAHNNLQNTIIGRPGSLDVKHGDVKNRMMGNWTLMMPTPLLRMTVIQDVGLFNEDIPPALEDIEYWNRCAFHTKFYYLDEVLVHYRIHESNISSQRSKYIELPRYLYSVLVKKHEIGLITGVNFKKLRNYLCFSQIKMLRYSFLKTICNLFAIYPYWLFNFKVVKMLLKKIVFK